MISGVAASTNPIASGDASRRLAGQVLDRDDFLNLLVTELRYQNPLDPVNNAEFIAQVAQFSLVDGMDKLNDGFAQMLLLQRLSEGANLIGKRIEYRPAGETNVKEGTVTGVVVEGGRVQLTVGEDQVPLDQVLRVRHDTTTARN